MSTLLLALGAVLTIILILSLAGCSTARPTAEQDRVSLGAAAQGYTCPLTGENLPCENCCPLNR